MKKPATFRTLIEALGGVKSFANQMGITEFAAKKMRDRNSIGSDHWALLARVARENALLYTTDDFVAMSQHRAVEKRRPKVAA
jgi:hypothetical protein